MRTLVRWSAWPVCVGLHAAPVVAAALWAPAALRQVAAATTVLLLLAVLAVEQWLPCRDDWSVRGDRERWRDVGHAIAYAALAVNGAHLAIVVIGAGALSALGLADLFHLWPRASPAWLQVVLVVVLGDGLEYGFHRLSHASPILWRVHAVHHTPVRLNVLKGARHHFLYAFGRGVFVWLPLLVLGAPAALVPWQFVAVTVTGLVGHANIAFRLPRILHRLVVTPEFHRLHHMADPRLGKSNLGAVLPLWDLAFGTHADPLQVTASAPGVLDDPVPRRFVEELKSPFTYGRLAARRPAAPTD